MCARALVPFCFLSLVPQRALLLVYRRCIFVSWFSPLSLDCLLQTARPLQLRHGAFDSDSSCAVPLVVGLF
eukprot:m.288873 g.288873  ORF g.288873 m.288873 type:complete len:71 (-) comp12035_c0_seq1:1227-1439(-)